jgi:hypothetical protein
LGFISIIYGIYFIDSLPGEGCLYMGKKITIIVLAVLAGAVLLLVRPRSLWLVDDRYREQWERVLDTANPPRRIRVVTDTGRPFPGNRYGFIISARGPLERAAVGETEGEDPSFRRLVIYPALSASREQGGALLLALDPWMMFRDFKDPAVSRDRIDGGAGEGLIILPGRDLDSRWAWAAQLLQTRTGVFPEDPETWRTLMDTMFWERRFQGGADTYGWMDALPLLYRSSPAWVYAPLSRIRLQPSLETSGLEANRYPEPEDWHEFGLQAAMLWAIPLGRERNREKLSSLQEWLADPQTQTVIADTLGWIPAHPGGRPYNAVSRSARLAYLSSSFIWTFTGANEE